MKSVQRILNNICSNNLEQSKHFYTSLFDFEISFDSNWFIQLVSKDKQLELGIISMTSDIVPEKARTNPAGFYITFVVENADAIFEIAKLEGFEIISEPEDTFYGQRRLVLSDPDGAIIDVSSPIQNVEINNPN